MSAYILRPYQQALALATIDYVDQAQPGAGGTVTLATAGGGTLIAADLTEGARRRRRRILLLAPRWELLGRLASFTSGSA